LPLILLGFFAIFSGYLFKDFFISDKYVQLWINSNVVNLTGVDLHHKNYLINFIPTIFAFFGIFLIFYLYFFKQNLILFLKKKFNLLYQFLLNKWYFDEFYNYLFVKNIIKLSENLWKKIDIDLIDKLGPNGLASSTKNISKFFSNLQTGYIYHYVFSFVIGMALLISFVIFFL
jgi:NADH-quinone oxidoreductase subunit L